MFGKSIIKKREKERKKETASHNLRTMSLIKDVYIETVVKKGRKRLKLVCKATKLNTLFFNNCNGDQNRIIKTKLFTQIGSFIIRF